METQHFETILDFLRFGVSKAASHALHYGHGTDNVWDEIHALILGLLSLPYDLNPAMFHARLTADEKQKICQCLEQRIIERVPVPYLTHDALFCGLSFYVDERVLIPRSPIAELIVQQFSPWIESHRIHRILDLCTGSGCIALACAYAFPDAIIDACDLSPDALDVAKMNRARHHLNDRVNLFQSDVFSDLPPHQYDVIVSNPPYVGAEEMQTLPMEYTHEPRMALEAERQGLAIVDQILRHAGSFLTPGGLLIVEVGNSQDALIEAYPDLPFIWLEFENGGEGIFCLTKEQLEVVTL